MTTAGDSSRADQSKCRYGFYLGLFLAAWALCGVLFDRSLPYPDIADSGDKIHYLAAHGDEFDTLFIGSSRINFGVVPVLFDQALTGRGRESKSFNAGVIGMRPPEQGFYLDQVLRQPHRRLRWVIIELISFEGHAPPGHRGTARYVLWHDAPRMMLLGTWAMAECAREWQSQPNGTARGSRWAAAWEPLWDLLQHAASFGERAFNLGRASFVCRRLLLTPAERAKAQQEWPVTLGSKRDGWTPYLLRETMTRKEREEYSQSYEARLRDPAIEFHDPASDAAVKAMAESVIRAGATPIFIVPPMTTERQYSPAPALAQNLILWSFADVRRYPALFAPEHRLDTVHLNAAGAQQFTLALAERFLELSKP